MSGKISQMWMDKVNVIYRAPQVYNAATNIFSVSGGPVLISLFGLHATAAAGGATTLASTFNGVAGEAGAVDIGTGTIVGEVVTIPMNVAAAIPGSIGAIPLTTALLYPIGMLVGLGAAGIDGVIILTFAVSTWTGGIFAMYRKLTPSAQMNVL